MKRKRVSHLIFILEATLDVLVNKIAEFGCVLYRKDGQLQQQMYLQLSRDRMESHF